MSNSKKTLAVIAGIVTAGLLFFILKDMGAIPIKIPEKIPERKEVAVEIEKIEVI
jgi:hypothetical protein